MKERQTGREREGKGERKIERNICSVSLLVKVEVGQFWKRVAGVWGEAGVIFVSLPPAVQSAATVPSFLQ